MRPLGHGDLIVAARVLRARPERLRDWCLLRLLAEADKADMFRVKEGRVHGLWGDGSLMAAALRRERVPAYSPSDPEYCRCLALVAETVSVRS